MSTLVTGQDLHLAFGTRVVLDGVSFAIGARDRIGVVGVNGAGKSSLLRIVAGAHEPDQGLVTRRRDLSVAFVPQEPHLEAGDTVQGAVRRGLQAHAAVLARLTALEEELPGLTGAPLERALEAQAALHEQVEALGGWSRDHAVRGVSAALGLPPAGALVETLSIGERRRVALAAALLSGAELLILDEPTNHLDAVTIAWLEEELATLPGALLLVTHDRYFLDRIATRILELDRGRAFEHAGNYTSFLERQAERLSDDEAKERARASFVRRELDWIRRGPKARGTKQDARIARFEAAVEQGVATADRGVHDRRMDIRLPVGPRLGKTVLELRGLRKSLGGRTLFSDVDLLVQPGDRLGVVGPNGAGKTTFVRTVLGLIAPDAGTVVVGQNTRFSFLDQGRDDLDDAKTVLEEVAGEQGQVVLDTGPITVRSFLRMMLFDDGFADTPVGALSGGERNRVQLAKLLRAGGNFLVLDEPTNDLDLLTLGVLEDALAGFPGAALVVSHDRCFLDRVATAVLVFMGDGQVVRVEGGATEALARLSATRAAVEPPPKPAAPRPARRDRPAADGPRRRTFREREELGGIEAAVLAAEARAADLEAILQDPGVYKERAAEVPTLVSDLARAKEEVERLYARWQELEALAP